MRILPRQAGTAALVVLTGLAVLGPAGPARAATAVSHPVSTARQMYSHNNEHQYFGIYTENGGPYSDRLRLTKRDNVYLPTFTVESASSGAWVFPNLGQGGERGMRPAHTWNPVPANRDGSPVAALRTTLTRSGNWNAGFDIWFEPRYDPAGADTGYGGTEIMVWTAARRGSRWLTYGPGTYLGTITEDHVRWHVNAGWARHGKQLWHRIYFTSVTPRTDFKGSLNPFVGQAIRFHQLAHDWDLTAIDYGFEINSGGSGLGITSYLLSGVRDSRATAEYGA